MSTTAADGPFGAPAMVARWPGMIWSYAPALGGIASGEQPPDCAGFRWLHLNLADQRSQRWIALESGLPPALFLLLAAHDLQPQVVADPGAIGLVLQDLERDFDHSDTGRIGSLRVALAADLVITGRHHPLLTPDAIRRRLDGAPHIQDPAAALEIILACLGETVATRTAEMTDRLLSAEDELLADRPPDTRMLISVRRLSTQLHRITAASRATLHRLESEAGVAAAIRDAGTRHAQRFQLLDGEIVAAQAQLRLLRDELDLQAAQRTNRILYFLSLVTGIMMPATLVTGYFGMNTSDLPFAAGHHGTLLATFVAFASAGATYLALRRFRSGR